MITEEEKHLKNNARNALNFMLSKIGGSEREKTLDEITVQMMVDGILSESRLLTCIVRAREELAERERVQQENAKIAETKRLERMSFENEFPRWFPVRKNDPSQFITWLNGRSTTELKEHLETLNNGDKTHWNQVYNLELFEVIDFLEKEIAKRENHISQSMTENCNKSLGQRLREFVA